jgi:hypothetical protein
MKDASILLLILLRAGFGQSAPGGVTGRVVNPAGFPQGGVTVVLRQLIETPVELKRVTRTDGSGGFQFDSLPPGPYVLVAVGGAKDPGAVVRVEAGKTAESVEVRIQGQDALPQAAVAHSGGGGWELAEFETSPVRMSIETGKCPHVASRIVIDGFAKVALIATPLGTKTAELHYTRTVEYAGTARDEEGNLYIAIRSESADFEGPRSPSPIAEGRTELNGKTSFQLIPVNKGSGYSMIQIIRGVAAADGTMPVAASTLPHGCYPTL